MPNNCKRIFTVVLMLAMLLSMGIAASAVEAQDYTYGSYGSYTNVIINWGERGVTATSLSPNAEQFYKDNDTSYDQLAALSGGAGTTDAYTSPLYLALQALMADNHTTQTTYGDTRYLYCYTDCENSDTSLLNCFYSATILGDWDKGATWNREHIWPQSKTTSTKLSNSETGVKADIMALRPTSSKVNSSRGNKAYGESTGYYNPNNEAGDTGLDVRGDVARILLYDYVRWSQTTNMWGSSGVIESLDILLKWMAEDPVDTWEMGRNDSVESITGTRNVFVDYPELAYLLFGVDIPESMTTPSGEAASHTHSYTAVVTEPTCTKNGYTTYTCSCGDSYVGDEVVATGHSYTAVVTEPTCTEGGYTTYTCTCGDSYVDDKVAATGHSYTAVVTDPTCMQTGYTTYTCPCGDSYTGSHTSLTDHLWSEWEDMTDGTNRQIRTCQVCGSTRVQAAPANNTAIVLICIGGAVVVAGGVTLGIVLWKKKK